MIGKAQRHVAADAGEHVEQHAKALRRARHLVEHHAGAVLLAQDRLGGEADVLLPARALHVPHLAEQFGAGEPLAQIVVGDAGVDVAAVVHGGPSYFCSEMRRAVGAHWATSCCMNAVICSGVIAWVCTISTARCFCTSGVLLGLVHRGVELVDDVARQPGGSGQRIPGPHDQAGIAELDQGRHIGKLRHALLGRDRQRLQLAGLDMRQRGRQRHAADLDVARHQIADRRAAAAIDDVAELHVLLVGDILRHHVADRADARRHVLHAVRRLLHQRDQLLEAVHAERRMHHEHVGRPAEIGDVGEVLDRIEARVLVHRRRQHMRRHAGNLQRVAIGRRARDLGGADQAAAAGAVLDEELLPERLAELLGEHAAEQIVGAAGRIGHDHLAPACPAIRRRPARQDSARLQGVRGRQSDNASFSPERFFSRHHSALRPPVP